METNIAFQFELDAAAFLIFCTPSFPSLPLLSLWWGGVCVKIGKN